jgi:hypothetical protein
MRPLATLAGIAAVLVVTGCPEGSSPPPPPTVTISNITCPRSQVNIVPTADANLVSGPPGSQYSVEVSVTVMCGEAPVEDARITVSYWWGTVADTTTNANGVATFQPVAVNGAVPSGSSVGITVTPDVGDPFTQTETVTVNN